MEQGEHDLLQLLLAEAVGGAALPCLVGGADKVVVGSAFGRDRLTHHAVAAPAAVDKAGKEIQLLP